MRVLLANFHKGWGGQPTAILMLARGLADRGHEPVLAVPPGSMLGERARAAGLRTFEGARFAKPRQVASALRDLSRLKAHLAAERYDLINAHGSQDLWTAVLARRGAAPRTPLVLNRMNTKRVPWHAANRWLYRQVDQLIVVSRSVLERYARYFEAGILTDDRTAVVPLAYHPDRFHPGVDGAPFRAEIGAEPDAPLVGVVGRLVADKGQDDLLRAAPSILARHPKTRFVLAGTGTAEPALRDLAGRLGVAGSVLFLGFRDDVPRITAGLDLAVLPSVDCDASPTVVKEALACGVPVVATDIGGAKEIIRQGETGLVVPPRDPARLGAAILTLLDDRTRARQMGRLGSEDVRARFSPDRLAEETLKVYEGVIRRGRRGRAA